MKTPKAPKAPPPPEAPPPPPTIDEAAQKSEESDRLRRRKGRLATIFAGKVKQAPTQVAQKTLTGE